MSLRLLVLGKLFRLPGAGKRAGTGRLSESRKELISGANPFSVGARHLARLVRALLRALSPSGEAVIASRSLATSSSRSVTLRPFDLLLHLESGGRGIGGGLLAWRDGSKRPLPGSSAVCPRALWREDKIVPVPAPAPVTVPMSGPALAADSRSLAAPDAKA